MRVLFVHRNFPAQFGQIAGRLAARPGWSVAFLNERTQGEVAGVKVVKYEPRGGATEHTHAFARTFENGVAHAEGVYRALAAHPEIRPDLIVGHSGFGSTALLPELTSAPVVNYFEYWYLTHGSDVDFRPDFRVGEDALLRARMRNAMIMLDLHTCAAGYSPTSFQRGLFPAEYAPKLETIHDGIDTEFWSRRTPARSAPGARVPRRVGGIDVPDGVRIVTYVARGFESIRGFDVFMQVAKRICDARRDVVVAVVGEDRVCYGGDEEFTGGVTFKHWVLSRDAYDLERIRFLGRIPPEELARLLAISDLHVYLTVPFVLSWSMLDAMSSSCVVLASDTPPVREFVEDGKNGLVCDFFDADRFAARALEVLADPSAFRPLGDAARRTIEERASLDVCLPRLTALFERVAGAAHA